MDACAPQNHTRYTCIKVSISMYSAYIYLCYGVMFGKPSKLENQKFNIARHSSEYRIVSLVFEFFSFRPHRIIHDKTSLLPLITTTIQLTDFLHRDYARTHTQRPQCSVLYCTALLFRVVAAATCCCYCCYYYYFSVHVCWCQR